MPLLTLVNSSPAPPSTAAAPAPAPTVSSELPLPGGTTQIAGTFQAAPAPAPTVSSELPLPGGVDQIAGTFTALPLPAPTAPTPAAAGVPSIESELPLPGGVEQIAGTFVELPRPGGPTGAPPPLPEADETDPLKGWTLDDPFASRSLESSNPPLKGFEWVSAMVDLAGLYRLDFKAIGADVLGEGHGGGIGDGGLAYGPFQDHLTEFRGRPFYGKGRNNVTVNRWAWSRNGMDYSMRLIAFGDAHASRLTGHAALNRIVAEYERPADIPGQQRIRGQYLDQLESMGNSWLPYLAGRMLGPASGGGVDTTPIVGGTRPVAGTPKPSKQWAATLHFFANDVPAAGANARKAGARARNAVRSTLWRGPTG